MRARGKGSGLATFEVARPKGFESLGTQSPETFEYESAQCRNTKAWKGGGAKYLFLHRTSLGGVAKKRTASRPLFGGLRVALADLGDLTDPGQLNGQDPVLF